MPNPSFSVRFLIRTKKQRSEKTPLRLRVWVSERKSYFYISTDLQVTPDQWKAFASDGTPTASADPELTKAVDHYKAAANLVLSSAIVNNRISDLTSELLNHRVNGVVKRMRANQQSGVNQSIVVFANPDSVKTCVGCDFCGKVCNAPGLYREERDTAPELAAFNGLCRWREEKGVEVCRPGAMPTDQYSRMNQLERIAANGIKITINGKKGGEQ